MVVHGIVVEALLFAADMFWKTWWALVLGFTLAGAVQTFVSQAAMQRVLGGSGPREIVLGTAFGAASSSCSYAAVATAKNLFQKGASAVASLAAFMFASTNLVIELGLVLWILLGWQFVIADAVAGLVLILLMSLGFRLLVPGDWVEAAREHVAEQEVVRDPVCGMEVDPADESTLSLETDTGTEHFCSESCRDEFLEDLEGEAGPPELTSPAGWRRAGRRAVGEWRMLWKDVVAGFLVAGLVAAAVPRSWWTALFNLGVEGTVLWVVAGCLVGVVVGIVTVVCSVGNVPFAAVLWKNGIPFGGVMSFIFADLIVPPLVDAYRRYYGLRFAATLFGLIFVSAAVSGVVIHYLWHGLGLVPPAGQVGGTAPHGYTLVLNAVFTPLFLVEVWWTLGSGGPEPAPA